VGHPMRKDYPQGQRHVLKAAKELCSSARGLDGLLSTRASHAPCTALRCKAAGRGDCRRPSRDRLRTAISRRWARPAPTRRSSLHTAQLLSLPS
jgi:hypothetical protein